MLAGVYWLDWYTESHCPNPEVEATVSNRMEPLLLVTGTIAGGGAVPFTVELKLTLVRPSVR
jgi:hypothetical protein